MIPRGSRLLVESLKRVTSVFNRLDENAENVPVTKKKSISDPKQALQKLQAQRDKLEKLKATDSEKAAALVEKLELKKAPQEGRRCFHQGRRDPPEEIHPTPRKGKRTRAATLGTRRRPSKRKPKKSVKVNEMKIFKRESTRRRIKKMGIKVKKVQKPGKSGSKFNKNKNFKK